MKSPFLVAVGLGAVALAAAFVPVVWTMLSGPPAPAAGPGSVAPADTPWSITPTATGGTRVFGLALPGSTLGDAAVRWGEGLVLAVIAAPAAAGVSDAPRAALALEGYVEKFQSGPIVGRLLLAFDADPAALARWRDALPGEPTESGARRHVLRGVPLAEAQSAALAGVSFIPAAQLDEAIVRARFGEPAEQRRENTRLVHWLYPATGLAVALDAEGKEVLQYVAPADFERRLAAPLRALPAPAAVPDAGTSPAPAR
jgi:hypothetical protein